MRYRYQFRDQVVEVSLDRHGGSLQATVDGLPFEVEVLDSQPGEISLMFAGRPVKLYWAADGTGKWISMDGCTYRLDKPAPRSARRSGEHAPNSVRAPMPAQVRLIQVKEGEAVEKGQTLLLLEAMKMEIRIQAPRAGTVARLLVETGQTVNRDQTLLEIREEQD